MSERTPATSTVLGIECHPSLIRRIQRVAEAQRVGFQELCRTVLADGLELRERFVERRHP
jgi:hypothetical protein